MNETSVPDSNKIVKRFDSDYVARMRQVFEERAERDRVSRDNCFWKDGEKNGIKKGEIIGEKKGVIKERIKNAISLMSNGFALDGISKSLGMPREELLEVARKHNITVEE